MTLVVGTATDSFNFGDWIIGGLPGPLQAVPQFPLSVASTRDLLDFANSFPSDVTPMLNGAILSTDTTINLVAGGGAAIRATDNFEVSVDDEIIFVPSRSGDVLNNCIRGAESTTPAMHNDLSVIQLLITALSHNQMAAEVIELEQYLAAVPIELIIPSTTRGDFSLPHGLSRAPRRAVVVMNSDGLIRLQAPTRFDATNVYLSASDDGLTGFVEVWP